MRGARSLRPQFFLAAALIVLALVAVFLVPPASVNAQSQAPVAAQLRAESAANAILPADGFYVVNDDFKFTIARKYGVTMMRFAGDEEVFVLSVERAPLGGRVLKYDTGDVALRVTGYGGVTIYTSTAPGGLPAERTAGPEALIFQPPTMSMLRARAVRFGYLLEQVGDLKVVFDADWARIDDGPTRYLAFDAMRITTRALRGMCANHAHQARLIAKLRTVRIMRGDRPGIVFRKGVLYVTIAPAFGLRGRLSSLGVARAIAAQL